uniref:Uncharacterized protein n=1 Tax=Timema shepardi TaxID=629360 RepID=A0A7R9AVP9_TIMSH|nr:unnamed protein product [Timema shepardi]
MQAQTSSRTSTSYPDLMQRHVDGDGIPHYLKSNYPPISPTVSGNNSCYHPHQQYQQQPLRRSFGHPGSIQATMRDSYINHHSTTNHNEMQWTSSYYGNTSTSQGNGRDGNKGRKEKKERGEGKDRSTKERRKSSSALSSRLRSHPGPVYFNYWVMQRADLREICYAGAPAILIVIYLKAW